MFDVVLNKMKNLKPKQILPQFVCDALFKYSEDDFRNFNWTCSSFVIEQMYFLDFKLGKLRW